MGGFDKDRRGPRSEARLGLAVPGKAVPGRDQMARHPLHSAYVGEPECNGVAERFIRTLRRSASICTTSRPSRRPER